MNHDDRYASTAVPVAPAAQGGLGLPITSLVLGIIGLCVPLVSLVALVLGVIAVVRAVGAGRGLGIAGICLGAFGLIFNVALMAGLLLPALGAARQNALIMKSAVQMKQIHGEIELKALDDPAARSNPNLEQWIGVALLQGTADVMVTGSGTPYLRILPVEGAEVMRTDAVLAENPARFDRRRLNVVFADGSVQTLPRGQVEEVIRAGVPRVFSTDGTAWTPDPGAGSGGGSEPVGSSSP